LPKLIRTTIKITLAIVILSCRTQFKNALNPVGNTAMRDVTLKTPRAKRR